ncbi:MAG: hypothetical protein LBK22_01080 [Tannerella sp.]|nr:hypothetical protein [Tannerella sp.]
MPRAEAIFFNWQDVLVHYASTRYKTWGVPDDTWKKLLDKQATYKNRYAVAEDPATHTPTANLMRKEARADYEALIRLIVKAYIINNPAVSDEDRKNMNLPIHDTKPSHVQDPTSMPEAESDSSTIRRIGVHFHDKGKKSKAKPAGVQAAVIRWAILDHPPVSDEELIHTVIATHSPYVLEFDASDRGKTVYFCLCWINTRGKEGPKSEVYSAIIP